MSTSIFVQRVTQEEYHIKLQSTDWELNVHMLYKELCGLSDLRAADWETRTSIKAGISAGSAVFWAYHGEEHIITILIGQDDETWDFAVVIPESQFIDAISPYIMII